MLNDGSFWVAVIALILSQLPPIRLWFKRARINIEVYSRISLFHFVGNPNAEIHVIVSNIGGRSIRIKDITLHFFRSGTNIFTLPVQRYFQNSMDKEAILFTPFSLKPDEEWSHIVRCFNFFDRKEEKRYRDMESALRQDIYAKRQQQQNSDILVEADKHLVQPIIEFFYEKFDWEPGEYEFMITVTCDKVNVNKSYRFTIFEVESEELKSQANQYKYGAYVYWYPQNNSSPLNIQIHENR